METAGLSSRLKLYALRIGIGVLPLVRTDTLFPTGQTKLHAPHVQHISLCFPKGDSSFFLGPLPEKPMALRPILSSHIRTQSPQ